MAENRWEMRTSTNIQEYTGQIVIKSQTIFHDMYDKFSNQQSSNFSFLGQNSRASYIALSEKLNTMQPWLVKVLRKKKAYFRRYGSYVQTNTHPATPAGGVGWERDCLRKCETLPQNDTSPCAVGSMLTLAIFSSIIPKSPVLSSSALINIPELFKKE
uniref:Putative prolyl 4-hydroxylase 9 n=1 Tax=Rhizophora mucronata TaxID=61149 RepID=A0A2P2M3A7_RHIMU